MAWNPLADELPELHAALAEAERTVGDALARTVGQFGHSAPQPGRKEFQPASGEWWLDWWLPLPQTATPFEVLKCELDMSEGADGTPEVSSWVAVSRSIGRGVDVDEDLWRSADYVVESPAAAAAAIRTVAGAMAEQLARLDLKPYLTPHIP